MSESPEAFHQRMWEQYGSKPSASKAFSRDYYDGFEAGAEYAEPRARNAALEEVDSEVRRLSFRDETRKADVCSTGHLLSAINALKSKPAPVSASLLKPCPSASCILAGGHPGRLHEDVHVNTWPESTADAAEREHSERKSVRRLGRCPRCGEDILHVAGCPMGEAENPSQPEPIHDFGWALQQMRAGKKVRRNAWEARFFYRFTGKRIEDEDGTSAVVHWENILATDWEVVE